MKTAPKLKEDDSSTFKKPHVPVKLESSSSKEFSDISKDKVAPSTSKSVEKRKHSALDDILSMEEKNREKQNRKDYWLHKVTAKLWEQTARKFVLLSFTFRCLEHSGQDHNQ